MRGEEGSGWGLPQAGYCEMRHLPSELLFEVVLERARHALGVGLAVGEECAEGRSRHQLDLL